MTVAVDAPAPTDTGDHGRHDPADGDALRRVLRAVPGYRPWVLVAALLSFVSLASGIGLIATSAYLIDRSALVSSIETLALTILAVRVLPSRGWSVATSSATWATWAPFGC